MHGVDWEAHAREVRAVPAARGDARRSEPRHAVDDRASCRVGHHIVGGGDAAVDAGDDSRRPARRRLRGRERPLPLQEGLRRSQLEPAAARAADRAGRERARPASICSPSNGSDVRPPAERLQRRSRTPPARSSRSRVGPNPDGTGSRTVQVVPIANEAALRNRDWVEGNLQKVDQATGGRVAYVYVPEHRRAGARLLQALLLSAGAQGRGHRRRAASTAAAASPTTTSTSCAVRSSAYWAMRYGADLKTPTASIQGPKAMIDRRDRRLGRRPAAVDVPQAQDGPARRQADVGRPGRHPRLPGADGRRHHHGAEPRDLDAEDGWVVENEGVPPDIEVEQTPGRRHRRPRSAARRRRSRSCLAELKKNPPAGSCGRPIRSRARRSAGPFGRLGGEDGVRAARPGSPATACAARAAARAFLMTSMVGLALRARGVPAVSLTARTSAWDPEPTARSTRPACAAVVAASRPGSSAKAASSSSPAFKASRGTTTSRRSWPGRQATSPARGRLAAALRPKVYESCTDVDGVYRPIRASCPRRAPHPRLELRGVHRAGGERRQKCSLLAPPRSVMQYSVPIHVRHSFGGS